MLRRRLDLVVPRRCRSQSSAMSVATYWLDAVPDCWSRRVGPLVRSHS
jgi:hypothetical protein